MAFTFATPDRIRCLLGLILTGLVLVGSISSDSYAKKPKKITRVVTESYDLGSFGVSGDRPVSSCGSPRVGCTQFEAERGEAFAEFEIQDAVPVGVIGQVIIDDEIVAVFCGSMERPVYISARAKLTVMVGGHAMPVYACGLGAGFATQGEVVATFSNVP